MKPVWIILFTVWFSPTAVWGYSGSSANYKLNYGIEGMGLAKGSNVNYKMISNTLFQPVGQFQTVNYKLYLGPYYVVQITPASGEDQDGDGIPDDGGDHTCVTGETENCDDNCPSIPNGPDLGTCVKDVGGVVMSYLAGDPKDFITCTDDTYCTDTDGTCQKDQGDYNSNGIGDACEGYADFTCSGGVGSEDLQAFAGSGCYYKTNDDLPEWTECQNYDLNDDNIVSTWDYIILKLHYGAHNLSPPPSCP